VHASPPSAPAQALDGAVGQEHEQADEAGEVEQVRQREQAARVGLDVGQQRQLQQLRQPKRFS